MRVANEIATVKTNEIAGPLFAPHFFFMKSSPRLFQQIFIFTLTEKEIQLMLILSRKKNEIIHINDDIQIVVIEVRGDKVRLGIEAPKEVPVHRHEIYEAINRSRTRILD